MPVETIFSEESESHDQHKNSLHVAEHLEGHGWKSTNADELAEVGAYCYGAGENYEELHKQATNLISKG